MKSPKLSPIKIFEFVMGKQTITMVKNNFPSNLVHTMDCLIELDYVSINISDQSIIQFY